MPHTTIQTSVMNITPALAARWLEGNVRNRAIDQKHVECLAQEMQAGRWNLTHQGIAFDVAGTLIDGQHRLWAILHAGCTVPMPVSLGLSPHSVDTIDGGKSRSAVDRMTLSGAFGTEGVKTTHASTLRDAVRGLMAPVKMPYHKEAELMAKHVEAVRFANAHVATKAKGIAVSYVRAVVARAWYSVEHDQLGRFCRVLSTGLLETDHDADIIRLRDQLMSSGSSRNRRVQREIYGKVQRVLLTWLKGETRTVIRPVTEEFFPLPEEVMAA